MRRRASSEQVVHKVPVLVFLPAVCCRERVNVEIEPCRGAGHGSSDDPLTSIDFVIIGIWSDSEKLIRVATGCRADDGLTAQQRARR